MSIMDDGSVRLYLPSFQGSQDFLTAGFTRPQRNPPSNPSLKNGPDPAFPGGPTTMDAVGYQGQDGQRIKRVFIAIVNRARPTTYKRISYISLWPTRASADGLFFAYESTV